MNWQTLGLPELHNVNSTLICLHLQSIFARYIGRTVSTVNMTASLLAICHSGSHPAEWVGGPRHGKYSFRTLSITEVSWGGLVICHFWITCIPVSLSQLFTAKGQADIRNQRSCQALAVDTQSISIMQSKSLWNDVTWDELLVSQGPPMTAGTSSFSQNVCLSKH